MTIKTFKEWVSFKEAPTPNSTILSGQPGAVQNTMPQNPMAATSVPLQYLSQLNNKTRLPLLMQTIMGAYNSLPPERRLDTFNREFSTLKQKIVASMMSAQSQQQQQQQLQPQQQPQQQQPGVAPQVGVAPQA